MAPIQSTIFATIAAAILLASTGSSVKAALVDPNDYRHEYLAKIPTCNNEARKWIRIAFHDAGTLDSNNKGGADGSLQFELDRPENADFADSIKFFSQFLQRGISMGDSIAYGGILAVQVCRGPLNIKWRHGRVDATEASAPNLLPNPHISAKDTKQAFIGRMGFTVRETVALIGGAHSVARVEDYEFLPDGSSSLPIDETPEELDVKFLLDLLEDSNTPRFGTARLPSDANMANDPEMGKQVKVLANNPKLFYAEFKRAFEKTIELGACYEAEGKYSLIDISSGKVGGGYGSKGPDSRGQVAVGNNSNSTTTTDSIDNNDSASSKAAPSAATQLSLNLLMNFAFSLTVPLILRIN